MLPRRMHNECTIKDRSLRRIAAVHDFTALEDALTAFVPVKFILSRVASGYVLQARSCSKIADRFLCFTVAQSVIRSMDIDYAIVDSWSIGSEHFLSRV